MGGNLRRFLSFDTGALGMGGVLEAKVRLYQTTNNDASDALGACQVDIATGAFNGNVALEKLDFNATATQEKVAQVQPLQPPQAAPDWVEAELSPLYASPLYTNLINMDPNQDMGRTQFRLRFEGTTNSKQAGWDSGETASSTPSTPPQLIVQYRP